MRPAVFAIGSLLAIAGCRPGGGAEQSGRWDLRSFDVPPAHRQQLADVLASVLKGDKGRVQLGPDGRLVVLAPAATQDEIKREILDPLLNHPPPPLPGSITMSYWMVLARPTKGSAPARPPALEEIAPALQEIEKGTGAAELLLLERFRLSGTPGNGTRTQGRTFDVNQKASSAGGRVVSEIDITGSFENGDRNTLLSTRVSLAPGQLVVVGQTGLRWPLKGMPKDTRGTGGDEALYFVLRAAVDDASTSR
jgi:hypothetical protein